MTTESPDERTVQRRVVAAMEQVEEPDRERLAAIERRLRTRVRRPRAQTWWWTIIGLGLAVGVAAAYWGMELRRDARVDGNDQAVPASTPKNTAPGKARDDVGPEEAAEADGDKRADDGPVIYIGE